MRAIYFVLFSYVCMYIAVHMNKNERKWKEFCGFMVLMALGSLLVSIGCAVIGI